MCHSGGRWKLVLDSGTNALMPEVFEKTAVKEETHLLEPPFYYQMGYLEHQIAIAEAK